VKIIKKFFGAIGYKLIDKDYIKSLRITEKFLCPPEKFIKSLIKKKKIKKIIQVGANDGVRDDFLNKCLNKSISIIFVEPIPSAFERLKYNYRNYKKAIFLNKAADTKKTKKKIFSINPKFSNHYENGYKDGDKEWLSVLASFEKKHLKNHGIKEKHIISKNISTLTFKEIIQKYNFFNLDLIVIDTEGFDAILVMNFLKTINSRPIIVFEHLHISRNNLESVLKILNKNNYSIIKTESDFICFQKNFFY
jgi:FkbM family methyltransferase